MIVKFRDKQKTFRVQWRSGVMEHQKVPRSFIVPFFQNKKELNPDNLKNNPASHGEDLSPVYIVDDLPHTDIKCQSPGDDPE